MNDESIKKLAEEIRRDFQIPPYFKDEGLVNYILEGEAELLPLVPYADIEEDKTYRMLLKNYVNYAYYHRVNDKSLLTLGLSADTQNLLHLIF